MLRNYKQNKLVNFNYQKGFTLVEVMVVLVIIGIMSYFIVPNLVSSVDKARETSARQGVSQIQSALTMYRVDNGVYPSSSQGLEALVNKPTGEPVPMSWRQYLNKLPKDPWGRSYQYRNPGMHGDIDIYSQGSNGENESDESKYIGSWDIN